MSWNEKALRSAQLQRGFVHSSVAKIKQDMGDILLNTGRVEEAVGVLYVVVSLQRELNRGADCPDVAVVSVSLLDVCCLQNATVGSICVWCVYIWSRYGTIATDVYDDINATYAPTGIVSSGDGLNETWTFLGSQRYADGGASCHVAMEQRRRGVGSNC